VQLVSGHNLLRLFSVACVIVFSVSLGHSQKVVPAKPTTAVGAVSVADPQSALPHFESVPSSQSGIEWVHNAAKSKQKYLPESSGPGCGFIDFDMDGWPDIYLVNGGKADFAPELTTLRNALYRNNHDGTFTDVTAKAGVGSGDYGMGAAVGDYDNDGFPDLYVTQYGKNILFHNNGNGTFTDVTQRAGVSAGGWSSSAVWLDYDNDGRLDLFVGQFAQLDLATGCGISPDGLRRYCIPTVFQPRSSWLFHNNGDGTFTDVTKQSGLDIPGKAWGAVATDIDNDGWIDLWVSNDTLPNRLYRNRGNGTFEEIGFAADVAYSSGGKPRSGMGVDSADYDDDGWMDLFVANIDQEIFSLYHNLRNKSFEDNAVDSGIGMHTRWLSGWGSKFLDADNDGLLDLMTVNGYPDELVDEAGTEVTYAEPLKLFQNVGGGFRDVSSTAGKAFEERYASRGLALGDFNNDGRLDALVCVNNGVPLLLKNTSDTGNHWLGVDLVSKSANRDAVGARISYQAGGRVHKRMQINGGGFLSASDHRIILGAGSAKRVDWIEIQWPGASRKVERFTNLPIDRYITITEGTAKKP